MQLFPSSICPFCEISRFVRPLILPWQTTRGAATLQKRRPSRMILSDRVARGSAPTGSDGRLKRKSRQSPFNGMNVTRPPRALVAQRQVSAAEQKRQTRGHTNTKETSEPNDPMRHLRMQQRLSTVSYEQRTRIKNQLAERDTFNVFDFLPALQEAIPNQVLGGLLDVSPTPIQRLAIPALLQRGDGSRRRRMRGANKDEMQQYLLAAETGSGKTLAYVLPIVDAIKRAEAADKADAEAEARRKETRMQEKVRQRLFTLPTPKDVELSSDAARPRAVILLPTAELVTQVGAVLKSISHTVKFRTAMISAAFSPTVIRSRLFSPGGVDVVVTTPHLIQSIAETTPNILSRVQYMVIDEADSLLDRSFSPTTSAIIDRATPSLKQLILCSATIPRSLDAYLKKRYPDTMRLATPNLHAIPRRVQLSVVDVDKIPYQGNRNLACAQVIWDIGKEAVEHPDDREKMIIVFVNERETAATLTAYLQQKGIDAYGFSRDSDQRQNEDVLAAFTGVAMPSKESPPTTAIAPSELTDISTPTRKLAQTRVLVTTDIASRGIDTTPVKHVILFDVPHTSIDFIHRLGRVGRMGRRGRGIVLVGRHDRKDIVKEVREGMFKGAALI
ncbi:hypothetical protein AMS68_006814 [Peltaster fructicola]|uniref:RNA helicase n=1 Tax=Peltaster fructicola TaxID=286661 RepID=A0A6H0Y2R6_9PEZI|nr:hypothetical protein AMS68_006814 [Peltaster fructicola]